MSAHFIGISLEECQLRQTSGRTPHVPLSRSRTANSLIMPNIGCRPALVNCISPKLSKTFRFANPPIRRIDGPGIGSHC